MNQIKVLVNGCKGRMGMEAVKAVSSAQDMALVAHTDQEDNLSEVIDASKPDVVVDFTVPAVAYHNAEIIYQKNVAGVIGTTGFTEEQIADLGAKCQSRTPAILIAPNFAIGALLMMYFSQIAARYLPNVEIIEMHHPGKLDAPSGTAVKTAQLIDQARSEKVSRETFEEGARGKLFSNIPIHSLRLDGFLANQEVIFGSEGQTLTIKHDTNSRTCFMPGVLLGIREVIKREGLIYGLDSILFKNES